MVLRPLYSSTAGTLEQPESCFVQLSEYNIFDLISCFYVWALSGPDLRYFHYMGTFSVKKIDSGNRVEICRDRHDQRSCKICASCVNFPKNNAISCIICQELRDLHTPSVILHGNY